MLRSSLRSIKSNCVFSKKFGAVSIQTIRAKLPKEKLVYQSPPVSKTGVDYFGPFCVTVRRSIEKRLGFLFYCLTTRAVYDEFVLSMNTISWVMGVERFVSRWGTLYMVCSDNGTKFIEA